MTEDRQELEARAELLGLTWRSTLSTAKLRERVEAAEEIATAPAPAPAIRNVSERTYIIGLTKLKPGDDYVLDDTEKTHKQAARMVELGVFEWL
jgi:hypothetical protein